MKELGVTSASASLISYEQLNELGCPYGGNACSYRWINNGSMQLLWTDSGAGGGSIYRIMAPPSKIGYADYTNTYGIRQTVIIAKSEIKFK